MKKMFDETRGGPLKIFFTYDKVPRKSLSTILVESGAQCTEWTKYMQKMVQIHVLI